MFGNIISQVGFARSPIYIELLLLHSISYPIKTHVDCFGALLFDMIICNPCCGGVIHLNGSGGLRVPHFFQCCSYDDGFFHVGKKSGSFGFCGQGNNYFDDASLVEYGSIVCRLVCCPKIEMSSSAAACLRFG